MDLSIEIVPGIVPMFRAPYRMASMELTEIKSIYKSFWIKVLSDPMCHPRVHLFYLKKKMACYGCALIISKSIR